MIYARSFDESALKFEKQLKMFFFLRFLFFRVVLLKNFLRSSFFSVFLPKTLSQIALCFFRVLTHLR